MNAIEREGGFESKKNAWWREGAWLGAVAVLVLAAIFWSILCTVPGVPWNAARLAPSFALARGLPIYALRDSAAHLGWFYGPVFPCWFSPSGVFEKPSLGLMFAAAWNVGTLLLPVFVTVRSALGGRTRVAGGMTLLGAILLLANPITQAGFYMLHVDGLCVACGLLACTALHAGVVRGWRAGLPVAAGLVALAIATKQVAVMLLPPMFLWLWGQGPRRLTGAWLFWLVASGGGLATIILTAFGAEQLLFNTWLVQSRTPWQGGWSLLELRLFEFIRACWLWALLFGLGWWLMRRGSPVRKLPAETGALVKLLAWVALWQLPVGFITALHLGSGLNSLHSLSYALVAVLAAAGSAFVHNPATYVGPQTRLRMALAVAVVIGLVADLWLVVKRDAVWMPDRGLDSLVVIARQRAGKIYLPWNPLVTIISERKIYPFDDALYCLWRAGLAPPADVIRSSVPKGAMIYYDEPSQSYFALTYFPEQSPRQP